MSTDPFVPEIRQRIDRIEALVAAVLPPRPNPMVPDAQAIRARVLMVGTDREWKVNITARLPLWVDQDQNSLEENGTDLGDALDRLYHAISVKVDAAMGQAMAAARALAAIDELPPGAMRPDGAFATG